MKVKPQDKPKMPPKPKPRIPLDIAILNWRRNSFLRHIILRKYERI